MAFAWADERIQGITATVRPLLVRPRPSSSPCAPSARLPAPTTHAHSTLTDMRAAQGASLRARAQPLAGRLLVVSTFVEDALRIGLQWGAQVRRANASTRNGHSG